MTNYNERLDEILQGFAMVEQQIDYELEVGAIQEETFDTRDTLARDKAKQDITSLIKELVEEAKPEMKPYENSHEWYNASRKLDEFEQNLLKELEEV